MSLLNRLNQSIRIEPQLEEGMTLASVWAGGRRECEHQWAVGWQPSTPGDLELVAIALERLSGHWMVPEPIAVYLAHLLPGEAPGSHHLKNGARFHIDAAACRRCSRVQMLMRWGLEGEYHGARGASWKD